MTSESDLVAALSDPAAYPHRPERVEHLQTHISHLFFAGDLVYKVKKPVDLGFLDYTSLDSRRHFCAEEVRLNSRLAAGVYRGVTAIRRDGSGRLQVGAGAGDPVEYAVEMLRLPAEGMLDRRFDRGYMDNQLARNLARLLVRFHESAATGAGIDEYGSLATVRGNCEENFAQTLSFTGGHPASTISAPLHRFLEGRVFGFLGDHAELFERRVRDGRIREGHGDLHAGNICVLDDRIVVYDCIEFAARFRCGDVLADLAFLLMDMDLRRFRGFARFLMREYELQSGDGTGAPLVGFYKGYRAFVRGKVASMGLSGLTGAELAVARLRAMQYFHLAATYELPPALILCCGLPGSGKSFAAGRIAEPFEAVVLNSDRIRKQLAGIPATEHPASAIGEGLYSAEQSARTYDELLRRAAGHLADGRTVVVDAGLRSGARRAPFQELARSRGVPLVGVHVDTAEAVILARLAVRPGRVSTSDAGVEVYRAVAGDFEPPVELAPSVVDYDGVSPTGDLTARVIDALVAVG